jgi:hypothetical protein
LHGPDAGMFARIDHQRSGRAKRVRISRAIGGRGCVGGKPGEKTERRNNPPPKPNATPRFAHQKLPSPIFKLNPS